MSNDLAPIDTETSVLRLGDKSNLLAQIKVGIRFAIAMLDFDQRNSIVLGTEGTLVTQNGSVNMKTGRPLLHLLLLRVGHDGCCGSKRSERVRLVTHAPCISSCYIYVYSLCIILKGFISLSTSDLPWSYSCLPYLVVLLLLRERAVGAMEGAQTAERWARMVLKLLVVYISYQVLRKDTGIELPPRTAQTKRLKSP